MTRRATLTVIVCGFLLQAGAVAGEDGTDHGRPLPVPHRLQPALDAALQAYEPDPALTLRGHLAGSAPSILPDLVRRWAAGFREYYPDAEITIDPPFEAPQGVMSVRLAEFLEGKLEFAFLSRIMTQSDESLFRRAHGYDPIVIPVSGGSYDHFGFVDTVAVVVNRSNPVDELTLAQLDALFSSTRHRGGSRISRWGELGLSGVWARRPIHVLGVPGSIAGESARAAFIRERILDVGDRQGAWRADEGSAAVDGLTMEAAVSKDPCAIGFTGLGHLRAGLKVLGLSENGAPAVYPTYENVADWAYPLTREIYIVLSRPEKPSHAALLGEFLKYILSRNGQQAVLAQGVYLPLRQAQVNRSLQILHDAKFGNES